MSRQIPVFWGCTITQRLPYIESTLRQVFRVLEVTPLDIEGVSCCPDPLYAKTLPHISWLSIAARNLALARKGGESLLTMCNGCYKVLKTAQLELRDANVRAEVNENLKKFNLVYEPGIEVVHLIEYLDKLGKREVLRHVQKRLHGINAAVHYGCHILRPRNIAVDSVHHPVMMEDTLKHIGVNVVPYPETHLCCGGTLGPFDESSSMGLIRRKVKSLKTAGADCMVVVCPSCFVQYDIQSRLLKNEFRVPVFHLLELMALAFGIPAEELHLQRHTTRVAQVLAKAGIAYSEPELSRYFDIERLKKCCGSCSYECSVARSQPDVDTLRFDPHKIVKLLVDGEVEKVLESPDIWKCVGCFDCTVFCPNNTGLGDVFETLRQLAAERGILPDVARSRMHMLEETGLEAKGSEGARKRLGLPASCKVEITQIKCLLHPEEEAKTKK